MADWTPPPFGSPVWFEIPAVDVAGLKTFYQQLFPTWQWRPATEKYKEEDIAMFTYAGNGALSGGIVKTAKATEQGREGGVTLFHLVESIDAISKKIEELGGVLLTGKEKEGESGWYMHIRDVAGNRFGIYEFVGNA